MKNKIRSMTPILSSGIRVVPTEPDSSQKSENFRVGWRESRDEDSISGGPQGTTPQTWLLEEGTQPGLCIKTENLGTLKVFEVNLQNVGRRVKEFTNG